MLCVSQHNVLHTQLITLNVHECSCSLYVYNCTDLLVYGYDPNKFLQRKRQKINQYVGKFKFPPNYRKTKLHYVRYVPCSNTLSNKRHCNEHCIVVRTNVSFPVICLSLFLSRKSKQQTHKTHTSTLSSICQKTSYYHLHFKDTITITWGFKLSANSTLFSSKEEYINSR